MDSEKLPEILTVPEVARFLRVNRKTVYDLANQGRLPGAHRVGRTIRVYRRTMLRWLSDAEPSH